MGLRFKCADLGMKYTFETSAQSKEELLKNIVNHVKVAHNIADIALDMMMKINAAIKQM